MNLRNRIEKLEACTVSKNCFCGKTFIDLCYGENTDALTYCPKCKEHFDWWGKVSAEATEGANLTDEVL